MRHTHGQSGKAGAERGFAMLFSVLVSAVLLSIGLSIFNLTVKELVLSSSGRESQFAFYAADTGAECALYWDFKGIQIFATSTDSRTPSPATPTCVDSAGSPQAITNNNYLNRDNSSAITQFSLTIPNTDGNGNSAPYCSIVTVTKSASAGIITTTIDSRGYNTDCASTDPSRIERAIRVTY